jgi:hypothetical protein
MPRLSNARSAAPGQRLARLLAVAAPALLVFAVAGCDKVPAASASAASSSASVSASGGTASAAASPSARAGLSDNGGQLATCASGDIKADLIEQPQRLTATSDMAILLLTNVSARRCRLNGWATVTLGNAHGDRVPVPTQKVEQPGAPTVADVPPGGSAAAGIKWTLCDKSAEDCGVGNSLFVSLPDDSASVPANLAGFPNPEKSNITMKSLQIGSIQPSSQGVVAW